MRRSATLVLLVLYVAPTQAAEPSRFIDANIRQTIQTLSSDAFGGRAPGSAGETLTIDYLAGQFTRYGLQPANQGSYLQDVPLLQITADPNTALSISGSPSPLKLAFGTDIRIVGLLEVAAAAPEGGDDGCGNLRVTQWLC